MYGGMLEFKDVTGGVVVTVEGVNLDCTCNVWVRRIGRDSYEIDQMTIDNIVIVTDKGTTLPIDKAVLASKYRKDFYGTFEKFLDARALHLASLVPYGKWDEADQAVLDTQ